MFFSDIRFVVHSSKDCNLGNDLHALAGDANDNQACRMWCANNAICEGFTVFREICHFKDTTCGSNVVGTGLDVDLYLKEIN